VTRVGSADRAVHSGWIVRVGIALPLVPVANGLLVMAGWMQGASHLVPIRSHPVPMEFKTALSLLALGLGIVGLWRGRPRVATWLGSGIALIAALTIADYLLGVGFGIDQLLMPAAQLARATPPGPTSPVTASVLLAAAVCLIGLGHPRGHRVPPLVWAALAGLPLLLGSVALFQYAADSSSTLGWHQFMRMAVHTAACLALIGVSLLVRLWYAHGEGMVPPWGPAYAVVGGLIASFLLSEAVAHEAAEHRLAQARQAAVSVQDAMALELTNRVESVNRMAARLQTNLYADERQWRADALRALSDMRDPYASITWVDKTLTPRWRAPKQTLSLPSATELWQTTSMQTSLARARTLRATVMSARRQVAPGIQGFLLVAPIFSGHTLEGLLLVELAYEPLLQRVLSRSPHPIVVLEDDVPVFIQGTPEVGAVPVDTTVELAANAWQLRLFTAPEAGWARSLPAVMMAGGLLLALAVGLALHLARGIVVRASRVRETNLRLTSEIDERARIESALQESMALQRAILEHASSIIVSLDVEGRVRSFNRTAERLLGYAAGEVIGRHARELFDEHEISAAALELSVELGRTIAPGLEVFVAKLKPGVPQAREWTHVAKDGRRFPVEMSLNAIQDEDGLVIGYVAVSMDITARRHADDLLRRWAEESKRHAEELLHRVLNASTNGIMAVRALRDPAGAIEDFEIQLVNPAAERMLKKPASDLVGRPLRDEMGGDQDASLYGMYVDVLETQKPADIERRYTRTDVDVWFRIIAVPLGDGLAITFEDISLRKRSEEDLGQYVTEVEQSRDQIHQQSVLLQWQAEELTQARDEALAGTKEMETALAMQADFVSFASHQLRTPLAGIKWLLELAMEEPGVEGELLSYLADSRASAERLIGLVNDLLDIARLEGGQTVAAPARVDLAALCRELTMQMQPNVAKRQHTLSVSGIDDPAPVYVDGAMIQQAIQNLLSNAIKYTPDGGQVRMALTRQGGEIVCVVEDSGIGVPEGARSRLFEKFFRADNVQTMETEGTGLGLFMVRLILAKFGGRIWYEPRPDDTGSRFAFALPAYEESDEGEADLDRRGRPCAA